MSLQRIGRWSLEGLLGKGGMGSVYRAVDPATGQRVALKTLDGLARASAVASLRREVRALSRIRHPGIVPIVDEGEEDGVPWYAMELVEGIDLQEASKSTEARPAPVGDTAVYDGSTWHTMAVDGPLPEVVAPTELAPIATPRLEWALQVVRELCDALGYLHGEGLVHRDLKPANVVIRADERPVLVDFGLSVGLRDERGRERALVGGSRAGTPWFMAPEQVRGKPVDPRTDLYALGCVICQLVTGQPPFPEPDPLAAMTAHLTRSPPRLDALVPEVPAALADLVEALLAKRPDRRPGYASDVAAVLESLGARPPAQVGPPARTYLYRPALVGRETELERLRGVVAVLAGHGPGGTLWIRGEGGVGKTRLVSELLTMAGDRGIQVLLAPCEPAGTRGLTGVAREQPLYPLFGPLQALADQAREGGASLVAAVFGPDAAVLAPYVPAVAALELGGAAPRAADREEERTGVVDALLRVLGRAAATRPLLLFLDDLQWADPWTLALLEKVSDAVPAGILVTGTWRTEEAHAGLDALWDRGSHTEDLARLPTASIGGLARSMLASAIPDPFAIWLQDRSEGNPFYVGQYLESAVETGVLARQGAHWTLPQTRTEIEALPVPPALADLLETRLERLDPGDRAVVRGLALLGREARLPDLAAVLEPEPDAIARALARAERAHLVELHPDGNGARFVHDRVREVAYRGLGPEAAPLHRRAATWLEARPDRERWLAELATHWDRAGEAARARPLFVEAALAAGKRMALAEFERLARAYLTAGPLDPEGFTLFAQLVHALLMNRPYAAETLALLDEAADLADRLDTALARNQLRDIQALRHSLHRDSDSAEPLCRAILAEPTDPETSRRAEEMLAVACQRRGDFAGAVAHREAAAAIAREAGDREATLLQLQALIDLHMRVGNLEAADALIEPARPDPALDDVDEITRFLTIEGLYRMHCGAFEQAVETALKGEQLCREHRMHRRRAVFGANGCYWAGARGDHALATRFATSALEVAREPFLVFNIRTNQVLADFYAGVPGTEARWRAILAEVEEDHGHYWIQRGRHWLAWMALDRGDVAKARRWLDEIDRTRFLMATDISEHQLLRARVARLEGHLTEARALLEAELPPFALTQWGLACERALLRDAEGGDPAELVAAARDRWSRLEIPDGTWIHDWLGDLA